MLAAGYKGEKIVLLTAADMQELNAIALLAADVMARIGLNVDVQTMDWGTLIQRRAKDVPPAQGGWTVVFTSLNGSGTMDPAAHLGIRANGLKAWAGWPTSPKLEDLRSAWFDTQDVAEQATICAEIQRQFWLDVPYIPLGSYYPLTAFRRDLKGIMRGGAAFFNVERV